MQEYDATLKLLLRGSATVTMREVTGGAIANWLDVELPKVQNLRVDLLGETGDGALVHLELQSTNDAAMPLLENPDVGDNVIPILTRLRDQREAIRTIVGRIAELPPGDRDAMLSRLEEEARQMPLMDSILDNKVLGREYKRGLAEGKAEGKAEGEMTILRSQIEKRFGTLPQWAEEELHSRSTDELVELGLRILEAPTLEDLLKPS